MRKIADWLKSLGMSEYERRFAENRIDFSVLPDLTDQDLEKLGVLLGDRRKMLRAIANLHHATSPVTLPSAKTPVRSPNEAKPVASVEQPMGERRHATVMFCDLVDSTGLATRLDVEEWRELVSRSALRATPSPLSDRAY